MLSRVSINDTQATIGEERLIIDNPSPQNPNFEDIYQHLVDLRAQQLHLLSIIASHQRRIELLEARTWWSMLKDALRRLWRG